MKIFITGATGFVGAHTALALLAAGHDCHLLVRNLAAAEQYYQQHSVHQPQYIVADMQDTALVKSAMAGSDAVVHAAALVDLDPRNAEQTLQANLQGIGSVIGSACELGIKKILYVSSISVLMHTKMKHVDESAELIKGRGAYTRSKIACEKQVRRYQKEGFPITITYPGGVVGPHDPKLSETNAAILELLTLIMPKTSAGIQLVDVRDLAIMQQQLLESDVSDKSGLFIIGGHFVPWGPLGLMLEKASGKKLRRIWVPGVIMRLAGLLFDVVRLVRHVDLPVSVESTRIATQSPEFSSAKILSQLPVRFRAPMDTMAATCQWLEESGHINAKKKS